MDKLDELTKICYEKALPINTLICKASEQNKECAEAILTIVFGGLFESYVKKLDLNRKEELDKLYNIIIEVGDNGDKR